MNARDTRSVVVAVDGRAGSAGALRYAVAEAVRGHSSLHLVHVWPGCPPQDLVPPVAWAQLQAEGREVLDRATVAARDMGSGVDVITDLVVGPRPAGILAAARGARLLVVGRSMRHRAEAPLGGTPVALAARADCPVVVVPSTWTAVPARGRILVGMKSRTHARVLLSHAFGTAQERGAGVVVVTAWELYDPTMDRHEARDHAAEWDAEGTDVLEELVEEWRERFPGVPVELRVTHGRAPTVLENASIDADLLLVGRRLHAVPPYGRLGSTAHTLLRTSRCPVEVVPAGVVAETPTVSSSPSLAN
jgi:nucleotide-binding universal stress UspA family protein